jgi:hypothetical protein
MIQDAELSEHRRLIPMEVLAGHFAALKMDDGGQEELGSSPRERLNKGLELG